MNALKYIVAGGSSGIGLEITKKLLGNGHQVVVLSRTAPGLSEDGLTHIPFDFTSDDALPEITGAIDGLVYCPGSIFLKPISTIKEKDIEADFKLNAVGAFRFLKAYKSNLLMAQNPGVVFFSSVAASTGMPFHSSVSMSKGAVEAFTRAAAAELAPSIRVNCIAPSLTDTPLAEPLLNNEAKRTANSDRHPLKRIGTATEIANLAAFVLTEANWMTGQILGINGGLGTLIK